MLGYSQQAGDAAPDVLAAQAVGPGQDSPDSGAMLEIAPGQFKRDGDCTSEDFAGAAAVSGEKAEIHRRMMVLMFELAERARHAESGYVTGPDVRHVEGEDLPTMRRRLAELEEWIDSHPAED